MRDMPSNNQNNARGGQPAAGAPGRGGVGPGSSGPGARGDAKTIEFLNQVLKNELTSINQYFLHSRMLADWGISELSKVEYDESIDEMKHADKLIQRILYLGGLPNLQDLGKLMIGENVEEIIASDLSLEEKAHSDLRQAIAYAESIQDYGSRELYVYILKNEEEHIDYLVTQQKLIAQIGITDYIQVQTEANKASALDPPGD
jgi:bacterioferritin